MLSFSARPLAKLQISYKSWRLYRLRYSSMTLRRKIVVRMWFLVVQSIEHNKKLFKLENVEKKKLSYTSFQHRTSRNPYDIINLLFVKMRFSSIQYIILPRYLISRHRHRACEYKPAERIPAAITIQLINVSNYSHLILILFHDIASYATTSSPFIMASVCCNAFVSTKTTLHILLRPHTRVEKLTNWQKKIITTVNTRRVFFFFFFLEISDSLYDSRNSIIGVFSCHVYQARKIS